ncbi:hypothetical protein D3C80_2189950 [compost metagenome]
MVAGIGQNGLQCSRIGIFSRRCNQIDLHLGMQLLYRIKLLHKILLLPVTGESPFRLTQDR